MWIFFYQVQYIFLCLCEFYSDVLGDILIIYSDISSDFSMIYNDVFIVCRDIFAVYSDISVIYSSFFSVSSDIFIFYSDVFVVLFDFKEIFCPDVEESVFQFVVFSEQEIPEEFFKKFRIFMDSFLKIVVVCTDESIPEIPGIFREYFVVRIESERAKIFYRENRGCPCVSFSESVNLPKTGYKESYVLYGFFQSEIFIAEMPFMLKIVVERGFKFKCGSVHHRISVQNLFIF